MKTRAFWMMALCLTGLGVLSATPGCKKVEPAHAADADKAAAEKAAAEKEQELVKLRGLVDKAAAEKAAADKAAADKAAADKAAADKAAADKAAAEETAAREKAEAAALPTDLVAMKSEIARALSQIDFTMAKFDILTASKGDLEKPSQDAVDAITVLETEVEGVKKRGDEMRDRGAAYFDAWEKQLAAMSTPEVVAIATKRKDELAKKYSEILTAMQESRAAFDPFWADMKAIQKAIEDGLTTEKLKNLTTQIKAAKEKAATLKTRVEATSTKLNQLSGIYTKP